MSRKSLFHAGIVALLVGIFLLWSIPVWLRFVEIYPWNYRELAPVLFWFSASLAGAGGLLLWRAVFCVLARRWEPDRGLRMFPGMVLVSLFPRIRHRPIPYITQLPNFGLIYGAVLWILIFLFAIVKAPLHHYGLPIDLRTRDSVIWEKSPWQETLSVYLASGEKYYLNGRPVPREALGAILQQELNHRMVWTVYFEADSDAMYMDAIYAMDKIQERGGKLVWITPRVRQELLQRDQPEAAKRE
jgi:biopolymer transport protein ExbD